MLKQAGMTPKHKKQKKQKESEQVCKKHKNEAVPLVREPLSFSCQKVIITKFSRLWNMPGIS